MQSDPTALVSVILPTYNRLALLRDAVDSVVAQTYPHWELLVVDDGSTDGTPAYLAGLADPRIRVVTIAHTGNSARARNAALAHARGDYVAFQDSDDLWMPDKLERQMDALARHPDCGWSYCDAVYVDEQRRELQIHRPAWKAYAGWILEDLLELRVGIPLPSVVVERRILNTVGGFNEALPRRHDLELWMRIAERSPAAPVAATLVEVRHHPGNVVPLRIDEQRYMDVMFAELAGRTTSPRIRRLARRRRALMSIFYADRFRYADRHADARAILKWSFPFAWRYGAWWVAVIKTAGRPLLPRAVRTFLLERARRKQRAASPMLRSRPN